MGYLTRFQSFVSGPDYAMNRLRSAAKDDYSFGDYGLSLDQIIDNDINCGEQITWYRHDDEMVALSKDFPDVLFELEGVGEEPGDMWKSWYRNGKSTHTDAKIVYNPPGDLDELLPLNPDFGKQIRLLELGDKILATKEKLDALQKEVDKLS